MSRLTPRQRQWLFKLSTAKKPLAVPSVTANALIRRGYARRDTVSDQRHGEYLRITAQGIAWINEPSPSMRG